VRNCLPPVPSDLLDRRATESFVRRRLWSLSLSLRFPPSLRAEPGCVARAAVGVCKRSGAEQPGKPPSEEELQASLEMARSTVGDHSASSKSGARKFDLQALWSMAQGRFPGIIAARQTVDSATACAQ
jgi:hypothetical protein